MSNKLLRQLTLARCIPHRPYKLTATQLQIKLEEEGIYVSLRTVQRDLEEMSSMGLFNLTSDERSKPHGWCFETHGLNDFAKIMPLSLAVALKTWLAQASHLLPNSILVELNPLHDKADQVICESQSEQAKRWFNSVYQSSYPFVCNPDFRHCSLIHEAHWIGRKLSADIKRTVKKRMVWLHYDHINPLGVINLPTGSILFCNLSELDSKVYEIPFDHIKNVCLTSLSATQSRHFNMQKNSAFKYQDASGSVRPIGFFGAIPLLSKSMRFTELIES